MNLYKKASLFNSLSFKTSGLVGISYTAAKKKTIKKLHETGTHDRKTELDEISSYRYEIKIISNTAETV